jgi:hypoxanthine phosphoribosyltransferase
MKHKNILIVDDSVDTGWTLLQVEKEVKKDFPYAVIKTAGYSVIKYSRKRISVDFNRLEDTVVLTCTSRKSNEYNRFISDYEKWILEKNQSCGL